MRFNENVFHDNYNNPIIKTFHSSVMPEKRSYREHHHTECELSFLVTGRGVYSVRGREYTFRPGDMFLFGSNEAHCITEISEELNLLNIHFEPRILWESPENIELLKLFASRNKNFSNRFSHTDETLKSIVLRIENELTEKKPGYAVQVKCVLLSALVHILRSYDYTEEDDLPINTVSVTKKLKDAMIYIEEHLESKLTLTEIAGVACMAPTYFSSVFKKFNGISPWDYIMIKRVERAIEMLKTTDMTKLEIAEKCGFCSASNFYKIFSKVTGRKPSDYKVSGT